MNDDRIDNVDDLLMATFNGTVSRMLAEQVALENPLIEGLRKKITALEESTNARLNPSTEELLRNLGVFDESP